MSQRKQLTRMDLLKVWVIWTGFLHGMFNWERMQALGVAHSMVPVIKRLYHTKEDIAAALQRHLVFFNTNTTTGTLAAGIMCAMEEERANGAPLSDEAINAVKTSLMGPLAGIGDSLIQGMLFPIAMAMGISLGLQGNLMGPVLYTVLVVGIGYSLHYWWFVQAYNKGRPLIRSLVEGGAVSRVTEAASMVGLLAAGALTARHVRFGLDVTVAMGGAAPLDIQTNVLDVIMPGVLPLGAVLLCWHLLRRGLTAQRLVGLVFLVSFGLGYFGLIR